MQYRENTVSQRSSILENSIAAMQARLEGMWARVVRDPKLTVFFSNTMDTNKALDLARARFKDEIFDLPVLIVVPTIWNRPTEGYNAFALQRLGVAIGRINDGHNEIREKVMQIEIGFGLRFVCRNNEEAKAWFQILLSQNLETSVSLVDPETGGRIGIKMKFDPQINQPEPDFDSEDKGDLISVETTVILVTYSGMREINTLAKRVVFDYRERIDGGFLKIDEFTYQLKNPAVEQES